MAHKINDIRNDNKNKIYTQVISKQHRIVLIMHKYVQKGKYLKYLDLSNNNLHKGNCIVYAPSAEKEVIRRYTHTHKIDTKQNK